MVKKKVTVKSKAGLHLRPARDLCKKAMEFESTQIMIHFREKEFNAKSMLGILSACVQQMDEIEVVCSGAEEEEAAAGDPAAAGDGIKRERVIVLRDREECNGYLQKSCNWDGRQFAAHAHGSRLAVACEHLIYSRQIWKRIRKMEKRMILQ